ncbi:HAD-IA family hydrolase [Nocardioides bruguierae]|uniref:HAD-IA family hydrolase n=1 Tax=Nocardioides bruguierae TaxID=2945102 RepID=A0A9X2IGS7_9ACTN|nr:HAD-IA family hydrolase [Nocardioides bruguierae]MCM0621085.1 HAD-IA family hydrolase [Nocardioides bruguierae]
MTVRAVVFDIGGVLEINDDSAFPDPWCQRHGIAVERLDAALDSIPGDAVVGQVTMEQVLDHLGERLSLTEVQAIEWERDYWRWYVGILDRPLFEWFAGLRGRGLKVGILSNSGPGAREQEAVWGFEDVTDVLIYSHEVGLRKPDRAVYDLTAAKLSVEPEEIVFLDDKQLCVDGARAAGWQAVLHVDTQTSIAELEALLG